MCKKTVSKLLPLFLLALLWGLPLHADELTEEQIKEISVLHVDAQRLVGEKDYQSALKIAEQVLDKLDQWEADEFVLAIGKELEVTILMRDQQYRTAVKKQKELFSLTKDLFGEYAPKTVEARTLLSDLEKIASLTPEQQKELSEGEAAYHAAVAEANLENAIALGEQMAAKEKQYLGEDCTWYTNSLSLLAGNYIAAKKYEQAEAKYLEGIKIIEKLYGQMHLNTAIWCDFLATLYSDLGEKEKARPFLVRMYAIRQPIYGDQLKALNKQAIKLMRSEDQLDQFININSQFIELYEFIFGKNQESLRVNFTLQASSLLKKARAQRALGDIKGLLQSLAEALHFTDRAISFGEPDESIATTLGLIGTLYREQGKYAEAEPLLKRALAIYEKNLGPDHPNVGTSLSSLSLLYQIQGKHADAEPLLKRRLAIHEKNRGPDHLDVALDLNGLADIYIDQRKYAEAESLKKRALIIYEQALGPDHPDVATSLTSLSMLYMNQGKYAEAEPLLLRSLEITKKNLGPDHTDIANDLSLLAQVYNKQGKYTEVEPLLKQALAIRKKSLGPDHPDMALNLNNLALLYGVQGKYAEAESFSLRALAIFEKSLGPDHPDLVTALSSLGSLYQIQGKYAEAEPLYERALAISKKALGSDDPIVATSLSNLGNLYSNQGKHAEAEPLLVRSLAIFEKSLGPNHPDLASALTNLAGHHDHQGDYAEAEPLLVRALAISEKSLGPNHPDVAVSLANLASLYCRHDKYTEAELLLTRALAIREKSLGPDHSDVAMNLNNLAVVYSELRKYAEAEALYERALAIFEKSLGPDHPDVALVCENFGFRCSNQGKFAEASVLFKRGLKLSLKHLGANANVQSERQQLAAAENLTFATGSYINSCLQLKEKYDDAYLILLASKGSVTRRQQLMRSFADSPELEPLFAQLQNSASQLSTAYSSNKEINPQVRQDRIDKLIKQKEVIEQQLSRQSQSFRQAVREVTPQGLQAALPPNSMLIDFVEYATYDLDNGDQKVPKKTISRLAAFIIRPDGPIELVDLCSREDLQLALFFWKENLGRNTGPAIELGKLIWEPLAPYVDDAELVLYSPVGELGSVPFAALPGKEPGSYLLEDKQLVMIPQAKLLPLIFEREQSSKPTVLAIGGVDYESVAQNETEEPVQLVDSRRAVRWNEEALFTPLPETESELEAVGKLYNQQFDLGKLQTLKDDRATEAAVKRLAPKYSHLHFATHGFFAPPEVKSALDNSDNQFQRQLSFDDQPRFSGFHPGLLSGLALAGANDPPEEGEDGIWTAEEVATMNLSKVDLAVLSACETGLGKVAGGEGLLGLQRAFQISGAGTTVASLWQVDDAATRALMDEFYRNLWEKKLPKIEALRQAQLKMLREYDPQKGTLRGVGGVRQLDADAKPKRLPPFYWAAWVLSGDWR